MGILIQYSNTIHIVLFSLYIPSYILTSYFYKSYKNSHFTIYTLKYLSFILGSIDDRERESAYYAIYRTNGKNEVDIQNPENLLTTVRKTKLGENYVDKTLYPKGPIHM